MEFITENMEAILTIAGAIAAVVWTFAKGTDRYAKWMRSVRKRNLETAWIFALDMVQSAYDNVVRAAKEEGEFDDEAKTKIKAETVEALKAKLLSEGVPILKELAPSLIEQAVNYLKGSASNAKDGGTAAAFLPASLPVP